MPILDHDWFSKIRRPSRYMGNEINSIRKDPSTIEVSMALAFPDVYEVGMSHLGLKILYHILNSQRWIAAERVFSPWVDLEKELRERSMPLCSLESHRPLLDFDIIGFSLQHELSFTNVLTMLDLSGIPFLSEERNHPFPIIIAGGPVCFNPEPIAPLFDAIVIGDGEKAALEICKVVKETKQKNAKKEEILHELTRIRGVYLPSFFKAHYNPEGTIRAIEPLKRDYCEVKKAIISDIDQHPLPVHQVVPFTQLVHDRLAVEISRGCTRGCRFCQAGMIYRPLRERSPESVIKNVEKAIRETGFEEISLLSLSSGDYSCLGPLLKELMDRLSGDKIAVSLPSLRIDSLDPVWLQQIKRVRKTGFTLAPEAGNDSLRKFINKLLTNQEILNIAHDLYGAGWNLIKLYFMIGLPTEQDNDIQDIINLSKEVVSMSKGKGKKNKLNVSISAFVPKSHTPFMWVPQITLEESKRRIQLIRQALKDSRIRVKWNQPELSWLEGIFARGDRRLTNVLIEAWRMGARFDSWGEHFELDIWKEAFKRLELDPEFYLHRSRAMDEVLPWDHIQSGITKSYLRQEWERALKGKASPDCREGCLECGICDHKKIDPIFHKNWAPPLKRRKTSLSQMSPAIKRYRITFSKIDTAKYLSHLELARLFIRALKRAGLKLVFSEGYHPLPKVSFAAALPVGTESVHETVDIELYGESPMPLLKDRINQQLLPGIKVTLLEDIAENKKTCRLLETHFLITMNGITIEQAHIENFLKTDHFPISKRNKKGVKDVNARSLVKSMNFIPPHSIQLIIKHAHGPELKPIDIIKGVLRLRDHHLSGIKILKTRQVMG